MGFCAETLLPPNANTVRSQREKPESGIVKQPTPEEARIAKEKEIDHSLGGVLKKTKSDEVSKKMQ